MIIFKILVGLVLSVYLLGALILFIFQRSFLYFPTPKIEHVLNVETFSNDAERVDVVVLNEKKDNAILYFGGNGESVIHSSLSFAKALPDHTLYLVNYRGYGGSSGRPSEKAFYSDAQVIYDVVAKRHASVSVIGRSLGSGVATFLASTREFDKLVLVTPYDSIESVAQDRYPLYPIFLLLKDKYDSFARIKHVKNTTLVILAENDDAIPFKNSKRLIEAFPEHQITVKTILDRGHNNLSDGDEYFSLIRNFM
ncbi:MAG: alpha/beta hydrolase [Spongiibacteraceae bacterium]|nr:alpha/beta hydrolase [Spongiibacteraceae bacterium]